MTGGYQFGRQVGDPPESAGMIMAGAAAYLDDDELAEGMAWLDASFAKDGMANPYKPRGWKPGNGLR